VFLGADPPFIAATFSPNATVGNFARRPDAPSRLFWPLLPRAAWELRNADPPDCLISISGPYTSFPPPDGKHAAATSHINGLLQPTVTPENRNQHPL
jgi:hypothetical protein